MSDCFEILLKKVDIPVLTLVHPLPEKWPRFQACTYRHPFSQCVDSLNPFLISFPVVAPRVFCSQLTSALDRGDRGIGVRASSGTAAPLAMRCWSQRWGFCWSSGPTPRLVFVFGRFDGGGRGVAGGWVGGVGGVGGLREVGTVRL